MNKGNHLIIDCTDVPREICNNDKLVLRTMADAAERAGANVISQVRYRFGLDSPPGFASVVLLDESHISAHCYSEDRIIAFDVFTCGSTNPELVWKYICEKLDLGDCSVMKIQRFIPQS